MDPLIKQLTTGVLFLGSGFLVGWYLSRREPNATDVEGSSGDHAAELNLLMEDIRESSAGQQHLWDDLRELFEREAGPSAEELRAHQQANVCYGLLMKSYRQQIQRYDPERRVIPIRLADEVTESERETIELANVLRRYEQERAPSDVRNLMKRLKDLESTNEVLREELTLAKQHILEQSTRLEHAQDVALRDHLTALPNRRALEQRLDDAFSDFRRLGRPFCALMLDLDHFKTLNDTHGHPAGDAVLKLAARLMEDCCRGSDFVARYGGEEFVIIAANTSTAGAALFAERIRERLENAMLRHGNTPLKFTCSIGVAQVATDMSPDELISAADQALYTAKEGGRNTVRTTASEVAPSAGSDVTEPVDLVKSTQRDVIPNG